jgi:hypothetical protein
MVVPLPPFHEIGVHLSIRKKCAQLETYDDFIITRYAFSKIITVTVDHAFSHARRNNCRPRLRFLTLNYFTNKKKSERIN